MKLTPTWLNNWTRSFYWFVGLIVLSFGVLTYDFFKGPVDPKIVAENAADMCMHRGVKSFSVNGINPNSMLGIRIEAKCLNGDIVRRKLHE